MIYSATGWFDIVEIPTYGLYEVTGCNDEYINKSSASVIQLFNTTRLCRCSRPRKVVFDNESKFKQNFNPLLNYFDIKPALMTVKNPQFNDTVERVHQVSLNMLVTKNLDNKVFNHIDPWGETLASIAWSIRASYCHTIMATPVQAVFGRDMIFNLESVIDWKVVTTAKQRQVDVDNFQ